MRPAVCCLCLALSLASHGLAAPAPFAKPNPKQPPLTAERVRVLLQEKERFFHVKSIERRGRATWEVVGMTGIPWTDPAWTLRTFLVSEESGGEGQKLKVVEVAAHGVLR